MIDCRQPRLSPARGIKGLLEVLMPERTGRLVRRSGRFTAARPSCTDTCGKCQSVKLSKRDATRCPGATFRFTTRQVSFPGKIVFLAMDMECPVAIGEPLDPGHAPPFFCYCSLPPGRPRLSASPQFAAVCRPGASQLSFDFAAIYNEEAALSIRFPFLGLRG